MGAQRIVGLVRSIPRILPLVAVAVGFAACLPIRFGNPTPAVVPPSNALPSAGVVPPSPGTRGSAGVMASKRVVAKRSPDKLIAEDGWLCDVMPDFYKSIATGQTIRCSWYRDPNP